MPSNRPDDRMQEVMQGLGKEPGRISGMIPVSKIWRWIKNRKKKSVIPAKAGIQKNLWIPDQVRNDK